MGLAFHGVTVNVALLFAVPPAVLMEIFPVFAPAGTVAVIVVPEFTVYVAFTAPNFTWLAPMNPDPVTVTCVPTGPLVGVILLITGTTLKLRLLVSVPDGVVTVTNPVVPSSGTVAVM